MTPTFDPLPEGWERVSCPSCGHGADRTLLVARDYNLGTWPGPLRVARCAACRFAYLNPRPGPGAIGRFYPASYVAHRELDPGDRSAKRKSKRFRWLPADGRGRSVLDVGCGSGYDLIRLRASGWSVAGVEADPGAAARARAQGLDVRTGLLAGADFSDGAFDRVVMMHVLEHLHDPLATLREVRRVLKPDGRVVIAVPNLASVNAWLFGPYWYNLEAPRHLLFPEPGSLDALLRRAGLRPTRIEHRSGTSGFRRSLKTAFREGSRRRRGRPAELTYPKPVRIWIRMFSRFVMDAMRWGDVMEVEAGRAADEAGGFTTKTRRHEEHEDN